MSIAQSGINLVTMIEIALVAVIFFCIWQQFQLRGQRAEIDRLEAQVEILIKLQDPAKPPTPNEAGALWQKLVAMRPAQDSKR